MVLFLILVFLPQLLPSYNFHEENKAYMGIPYNVVDTNNYFSYMQQAREGHFLFTNKFTAEKVPYILFQPVFLPIGWLTALFPAVFVYFAFKFIFLIIFVYLIYKFLKLIVNKNELNVSLFFVLFGSGIGYVYILLNNIGFKKYGSIDYQSSATSSIGLNIAPVNFVISVCLMILIVICYYKFWESKKIMHLVTLSALTLLLGFTHLFDVITLIPAFGIYMLWRLIKKKDDFGTILKYNLIYALIAIIPFIYTYYIFAVDPYFKEWNVQNVLETPKFLHVLFGYFFPLIFALFYFTDKITYRREWKDLEVILFTWMLAGLFLLYAPLNIQRRFIEGLNIPIMILGSLGFTRVLLPKFEKVIKSFAAIKNPKSIAIFSIFILISPTSFYWLYKINSNISPNVEVSDYSVPYYLDKDELEALNWLKENTYSEELVLSAYGIGNYIPRISANRVFLGHWAQTINFEKKKKDVKQFFSANDNNSRKKLIDNYGIDYVYYGVEEKQIGDFKPKNMEKVFENEKVTIFKIS